MTNNLLFLLIITLFTGFTATAFTFQGIATDAETEGRQLVHTVYFWLNDDVSEEEKRKFYSELKTISKIPHILHAWVGIPAQTGERGVVDTSYDFSITFVFESVEAEHEYQVDPVHLEFVENNSSRWEKVVVYDAITPEI